ncbi:MAG: hypothetical protein ACPG40_06370 [Alphaproteobacteria bacterium]
MVRLLSIAAFAVLSAITFATPSQALSCLPPTPENSFARYHAAPELYQVWSGRWIKTHATPNTGGYVDPVNGIEPYPVWYRFRGRMVGPNGAFGPIRLFNVKVDPQCAGPWCAGYPEHGEKIVGFFERPHGSARRFEPLPCGGEAFPRTHQNINRIASCFNSGACN